MAIFKRTPLSGNCITPAGKLLEFTGNYYETEKADEIEFLKTFDCYEEVKAKDASASVESAPAAAPKAVVGATSSATTLK